MTTRTNSQLCQFCKHFNVGAYDTHPRTYKCEAFLDGIPMIILGSLFDHHNPYPNDNGIQFVKYDDIKLLPKKLRAYTSEEIEDAYNHALQNLNHNLLQRGDEDNYYAFSNRQNLLAKIRSWFKR